MPWSLCAPLPQAVRSLLSSHDGSLPPKQARTNVSTSLSVSSGSRACEVEILHLTLSTLRRALQGDELENKTTVTEECWEVQRAAIAAGRGGADSICVE